MPNKQTYLKNDNNDDSGRREKSFPVVDESDHEEEEEQSLLMMEKQQIELPPDDDDFSYASTRSSTTTTTTTYPVRIFKILSSIILFGILMVWTVRIRPKEVRMTTIMSKEQQVFVPSWAALQHLANMTDIPINSTDIPFFFHIPRSGGSTIKDILGVCFGLVAATDYDEHDAKQSLEIVHSEEGAALVNVNMGTTGGIYRAKQLGLIQNHVTDVIVSQHLYPIASTLFNSQQRGRTFTLIRHPIERAISTFHYLGVANWEPTYDPELAYISIDMYARSHRAEHNLLTRLLSNQMSGNANNHNHNNNNGEEEEEEEEENLVVLNRQHLEMAKQVLRQKCLVGLLEQKGESFRRFEQFFGWHAKTKSQTECKDRILHYGWSNKHSHPQVEEGSTIWDLLYKKNALDMELYEYAKELFAEQAVLFQDSIL